MATKPTLPTVVPNTNSQNNPTVFSSNQATDQIAKSTPTTGVTTGGIPTSALPINKTPTAWEISQGFYTDANLLKPGQTRVGPGGQITNFGDNLQPSTVGAEAAKGVTDPNIIGSYGGQSKTPLQLQNEAVANEAKSTSYSGQMTDALAEQIGKMQGQINDVTGYGKEMGSSFSDLMKKINEQSTLFATKLQEFAKVSLQSNNTRAAEAGKVGQTGTQIRAGEQGLPDRTGFENKQKLSQLGPKDTDNHLLFDDQYFGNDPTTSVVPSTSTTTSATNSINAITPPPIKPSGSAVDDMNRKSATDFWTNYINTMGSSSSSSEFNDGTNVYDSIAKDMASILALGVSQSQDFAIKDQDRLLKLGQLMKDEHDATKVRVENNKKYLTSKAIHNETSAVAAMEHQRDRDISRQEDSKRLMEERTAMQMGVMTGQLAARGALGSSAALQMVAKYTESANMQIRYATEDLSDAQSMWAGKIQGIHDTTFDQLMEIENNAEEKLQASYFSTQKGLLDIEGKILESEDMKQKNTIAAAKELAGMTLDIQKTKDAQIAQLKGQKLEEAKFEYSKVMDSVKNEQWAQQFGLSVEQFNEQKTQNQFAREYQKETFDWDKSKYWNDDGYRRKQDAIAADRWAKEFDFSREKFTSEEGRATAAMLNEAFKNNQIDSTQFFQGMSTILPNLFGEVMGNTSSTENISYGDQKLGDRVAKAEAMANQKRAQLGAGYQCVQFVRDIIPDLPFLGNNDNLQNKINKLVNSPNGSDTAVPGAAVILDWGSVGHLAFVKSVDPANDTMVISQFNKVAGKFSEEEIPMSNKAIKGYWVSPQLGYERSEAPQEMGNLLGGLFDMGMYGNMAEGMKKITSGYDAIARTAQSKPFQEINTYQPGVGEFSQSPSYTSKGINISGNQTASAITKAGQPNYSAVAPEMKKDVQDFWRLTNSNNLDKESRSQARQTYMELAQSGDTESARQYMNQVAVDTLPAGSRTRFEKYNGVDTGVSDLLQNLGNAGNMNIYKSFMENNINPILAMPKDERWASIGADFQSIIAPMKTELIGASQSEQEQRSLNLLLTDFNKATQQDLAVSLRAIKRYADREKNAILNTQKGNF